MIQQELSWKEEVFSVARFLVADSFPFIFRITTLVPGAEYRLTVMNQRTGLLNYVMCKSLVQCELYAQLVVKQQRFYL